MKYRSKPVECEAMQWTVDLGGGMTSPDGDDSASHHRMVASWIVAAAEQIVAWVNTNGGEARYEPEPKSRIGDRKGGVQEFTQPPRIAIRTVNGPAYAAPGWYVVMGTATFDAAEPVAREFVEARLSHLMPPKIMVRDFYPCDPETFERRWEPTP